MSRGELRTKAEGDLTFFERFAEKASSLASSGIFFAACVLMVIVWAPSGPLFKDGDTHQLVINTATTIITFLMVALLQNSQKRFENSVNLKLNAMADALADLMEVTADGMGDSERCSVLHGHADDLRAAVGIEDRVSA